jgi:hypothetical protein
MILYYNILGKSKLKTTCFFLGNYIPVVQNWVKEKPQVITHGLSALYYIT